MRSTGLPLAAPTGAAPRDSADVILEQETATRRLRIKRRLTAAGAGLLALLYGAAYIAPLVAPDIAHWQGQDRYEKTVKKETPPR
jgi:hypothetical protein